MDVVISFPKSGRTWLRVMLDELGIHLEYTHAYSGHRGAFHMSELDTEDAKKFGRILFLHRDPRDTAISGYYQKEKRLRGYEGSMSDFIRSPNHGVEKIIHFNKLWTDLAKSRSDMMVVSYEQLHADSQGTVREIAKFFGYDPIDADIERAVSAGQFDTMKDREKSGYYKKQYGGALLVRDLNDENSFKVRKGQVGGYRDELSDEDIAYCDKVVAKAVL
jgi:hypothetical protein